MAGGVLIYAGATAVAAIIATRAARANPAQADLGRAAGVVVGIFLASLVWSSALRAGADLLGTPAGRPWSMVIYPPLDGAFLAWVGWSAFQQFRVWKLILGLLVLFQLIVHVPYWGIVWGGGQTETLDLHYIILLNSSYTGQLVVLSGAGLLDGLSRRVRARRGLPDHARGVRALGRRQAPARRFAVR